MISLQEPKIYIDQHCEVHDLLSSVACKDFADFDYVDIRPGAVYVVGSDTMIKSSDKRRNIVEYVLAHIVFSKPVEGATTILGQFARFPTQDLIESGRIIVLAGGPLEKKYRHVYFENFLQRLMNFEENIAAQQRTNEIYNKVNKPFKFLMFNESSCAILTGFGLLPHAPVIINNKGMNSFFILIKFT
jgi:hypothetical protein